MFTTQFYNVLISIMGHCYNFVMTIVSYISQPVTKIFDMSVSFYNPFFDNTFSLGIDLSQGFFGVVTGVVADILEFFYGADTQIWVMCLLACSTLFLVLGIYKAFK